MAEEENPTDEQSLPLVQKIISVLWPSFLTAGIATILFFTVFDPIELALLKGWPEISRLGGYTMGFFMFWILTSLSCALTCYFRKPCTPKHYRKEADSDPS